MERKKLAKKSSSSVRKDNALFSLFRKYLEEDAAHVFPNGKMPSGCFGCQFNNTFRKWSTYIITGKPQNSKPMLQTDKTYKLRKSGFIAYFKGEFLSKKSTDEQWQAWINYPRSQNEVKKRKAEFTVLPQVVEAKTTKAEKVEIAEEVKKNKPKSKSVEVANIKVSDPVEVKETEEEKPKRKRTYKKKTSGSASKKTTRRKRGPKSK